MKDRARLIELMTDIMANPDVTCIHYKDGLPCDGCPYDNGVVCNENERAADYLIKNGITFKEKKICAQELTYPE